MTALDEALQWLLDVIGMWLQSVVRPVTTLNRILLESTDDKQLSAAKKVWVSSLLISLIISFPLLNIYGIEWNNVGYHLCNWMIIILSLVANAFIFHNVLLLLKLKSDFARTLVIYTVIVTTFAPVLNLLVIPITWYNFAAIQNFKQHPIAIHDAIIAYFRNMSTSSLSSVGSVGSVVAGIFSIGIVALFAESICQSYGNDRFRCYSALAISGLLSGVVVQLVTPMQFFIMYAFLK